MPSASLRLEIDHAVLKGVTTQQMEHWFRTLEGTCDVDGVRTPKYLLWHTRDHIHYCVYRQDSQGDVGPGAYFHVVEAFSANPRFLVNSVFLVEQLDETGITMTYKFFGRRLFVLAHSLEKRDDGTACHSSMQFGFGSSFPPVKLLNHVLRRFLMPDDKARAWIKHSVEEIGNLEHLIPLLMPQQANISRSPTQNGT